MGENKQLIKQIKSVLEYLEKDYVKEINNGVLQLLHKRYKNALEILKNDEDIEGINIIGGVRAYMDSYSDYDNPLLGEMHEAEKLYKNLLRK